MTNLLQFVNLSEVDSYGSLVKSSLALYLNSFVISSLQIFAIYIILAVQTIHSDTYGGSVFFQKFSSKFCYVHRQNSILPILVAPLDFGQLWTTSKLRSPALDFTSSFLSYKVKVSFLNKSTKWNGVHFAQMTFT